MRRFILFDFAFGLIFGGCWIGLVLVLVVLKLMLEFKLVKLGCATVR